MDRAPRHPAMVDFQQHQQRLWVVLEEDHEKVEQRAALLEGLLREMLEAYDDGVGREDEHGNNWEFPLWQKVHAALAGQLPAAEHPFAKRLREAGPQIAAEVDRMMAATPSEDGPEMVDDDAFHDEFAAWWESDGQYVRAGGGGYERSFAFEAWRHLIPKLAQHSRIVAAKDAEIARLREAHDDMCQKAAFHAEREDALRADLDNKTYNAEAQDRTIRAMAAELDQLRAKPARQVGGGEREYHCDYAGCSQKAHPGTSLCLKHHTPKARAALSPVAMVMPEYERNHAGLIVESVLSPWNAAPDEVGRLNRRAIPVGLLESLSKSACRLINEVREFNVSGVYFTEIGDNLQCLTALELENDELRALLGKDGEGKANV